MRTFFKRRVSLIDSFSTLIDSFSTLLFRSLLCMSARVRVSWPNQAGLDSPVMSGVAPMDTASQRTPQVCQEARTFFGRGVWFLFLNMFVCVGRYTCIVRVSWANQRGEDTSETMETDDMASSGVATTEMTADLCCIRYGRACVCQRDACRRQ